MTSTVPRLVIAAPSSGSGKTTVAIGVMHAFLQRGLCVAPFKLGPDYIDPTHHQRAASRPSRTLDSWLLNEDAFRGVFHRGTTGEREADIAVIEGVMGLFDGRAGPNSGGSTADGAALLRAPIVLVVDAHAMAQSAAAIVHGFHTTDPDTRIAAVILNRVAGAAHADICRAAIEWVTGVPVVGWLPRDPAFAIPERHLGLTTAEDHPVDLDRLATRFAASVDLDALWRLARRAPALETPDLAPLEPSPPAAARRPVIAVARDRAFSFYYDDALDLLTARGAELRTFSPLADLAPPADADLLYFGGGYPEIHAAELAANTSMRAAVRAFARAGRPVYAECGGLMYLCEAMNDLEGARHSMVGVVPGTTTMSARVVLGYRDLEALTDSPLAASGHRLRGHEFHYSRYAPPAIGAPPCAAYRQTDGDRTEGVVTGPRGNVLASYVHVHLASDRRLADRLIATARATTRP